ncbi:hypothetical protein BDV93DRAFT_556606, partial [Ceratobasidium sp. AG-I]
MKRFGRLVVLFCAVLQGWALSLSWPADGGIVADTTIQVSFSGGVTPYTLTVLGFVSGNADSQLQVFTNQMGDSIQWLVSVPDGFVRFNVTDAGGGTVVSYWQTVHPNAMIAVSSASAQSAQAYISRLSTSAQWAAATGSAGPQSGTPTAVAGATSKSSNNIGPIVGGVLGGVAALLAVSLFVFWRIRHRYPVPEDDNATHAQAWNNAQDKESTTLHSQYTPAFNPYQQVPIGSQPASP